MPTVYDQDADQEHDVSQIRAAEKSAEQAGVDREFNDIAKNYDSETDHPLGEKETAAAGAKELADKEGAASDRSGFSAGDDRVGGGYRSTRSKVKANKGWWNKRKAKIAGGIAGVGTIGGILGLTITSGPLQFIHAAQLLQNSHFSSNEEFGDSRGSKVLLYALAGIGAERGRLGIAGNRAADAWEKRMVNKAGLRPVYDKSTRLFKGFEIMDEAKARQQAPELFEENGDYEKVSADKAKSSTIGTKNQEVSHDIVRPKSNKAHDAKALRGLNKVATKATDTNKLVSTIASRLMKKRDGITMHPLRNTLRDKAQSRVDYNRQIQEEQAKSIENGVDPNSTSAPDAEKDKNGNVTNQGDIDTSGDTNQLLKDVNASTDKSVVKETAKKLGKGALAVGVLCAARGFGNDIEGYKYTHDALPMLRMGMNVITIGNQVMSGQDVNADELGALSEQFYDEGTKTSFFDAKSIRANTGQDGTKGVDLPNEASLGSINDKPEFFKLLDAIPGLGTACHIQNSVSSIPIIGDLVDAATTVFTKGIDFALSAFGTSSSELMEKALAIASGKGVDALASGGQFGALADTGAFLAANDNAMSMGGAPLSAAQTAQLNDHTQSQIAQDRQSESIASRYFNPYDYASLTGMAIDDIPHSVSSMASALTTPLQSFGSIFNNFGHLFSHKSYAFAAYDYGAPQFGFSLADQEDQRFENPYANADIVENQLGLDNLNSKYGKCFGMTATADASGVHIESASMGDASLNQFKVAQDGDCTGNSEEFLRYRFYLADAIAVSSLDCYENNDSQSCANVGMDSGTSDVTTPGTSTDSVTLAKQVLADNNIVLSDSSKADLQLASEGQKITPGPIGDGSSGLPGCSARTPTDLNPELLKTALNIAQKYKYQINDIVSGHDCDTGKHPIGRAMDIFYIDSKPLDDSWWASVANVATINDIGNIVHNTGSYQFGFGVGCTAVSKIQSRGNLEVFSDSCNPQDEIHIDVRGAP